MRQLPGAYWTEAHGPVYAYHSRDDTRAFCVSWRDEHVTVHHDELLPPRECIGAAEIADLAEAIGEMMAPHRLDGGGYKLPPPRAFDTGEVVLNLLLFWDAIYARGEMISQGWGRPPRAAVEAVS